MTFLWGAATAAHQIEGNNVNSDWWAREHAGHAMVVEPSGDACDSYHRWHEDMDLLAGAGLTDYRFSIEWARIEPAPGEFSQAQLDHYRAMIDGALARGIRPMVTLHHFTVPRWFRGWTEPDAPSLFGRYAETVAPMLGGVAHVCTINEPNMVVQFHPRQERDAVFDALVAAHRTARKALPGVASGWSIACQDFHVVDDDPGTQAYIQEKETRFVEAAVGDDWIGVQSYSRTRLGLVDGRVGQLPVPEGAERTLTGWEFYPAALGEAVRQTALTTGGMPMIVTENGIATDDDTRRIAYTEAALDGLRAAIAGGADVRGYFHWSLLDNYEWGRYAPTFGLIAVDRTTFTRTPKPSLTWLGSLGGL